MAAKHCASSTSYRAFFHGLGQEQKQDIPNPDFGF
jgi:hypothetical protein